MTQIRHVMARLPRPVLIILASLGLIATYQYMGLIAPDNSVLAPPTAAATTGYICNHKDSDEWIAVKRGDNLGTEYLIPGDCAYYLQMEGTRVDTDTTGTWSFGVDTNSYQLIYNGSRHACHNGETNDSDPPNIAGGVTYETWRSYYCPLPHP